MKASTNNNTAARRYKAYVGSLGTTQLHLRNPWVIAFWSAMFPGFGHLLLSKYLRGYLLFVWEVYVNINSNINLAILYSFTGNFEMAKNILDKNWTLMYISTFLFAIWDSYRTTVDLNNMYILAAREDAQISVFKMDLIEINYLDKKAPWSTVLWSMIMPGAGQLAIHRIVSAFFILIWWIVIVYYSKVLPSIHFTLVGDFSQAKDILNQQWFLNIPSIYFFALYDAYINNVESNKLFEWEQSKFLINNYQNRFFNMPDQRADRGGQMHIVSTFEHSIFLEKAITALQMKGIAKENILAIPLDKRGEEQHLFDSIHRSDGLSLLDLPFVLGAFFMLLGGIYGFYLAWGPILWGLIGMVIGIGIGFAIKLLVVKKYTNNRFGRKGTEVVLIIECKEFQMENIKDMLWAHHALGVRKLELNSNE